MKLYCFLNSAFLKIGVNRRWHTFPFPKSNIVVVKPTAAIQNTLNRHEKRQNSNVWRPIPHVLLLLHNLPKWKVEAEVFRCVLTKIDDSGWNIILSPCSEKGEEKVHSFYVSLKHRLNTLSSELRGEPFLSSLSSFFHDRCRILEIPVW